jgi:hypothetical protein
LCLVGQLHKRHSEARTRSWPSSENAIGDDVAGSAGQCTARKASEEKKKKRKKEKQKSVPWYGTQFVPRYWGRKEARNKVVSTMTFAAIMSTFQAFHPPKGATPDTSVPKIPFLFNQAVRWLLIFIFSRNKFAQLPALTSVWMCTGVM